MRPSILGKLEPFVTVLRVAGFVKLKFTMTWLTDSVNLTTDDSMTVYDL